MASLVIHASMKVASFEKKTKKHNPHLHSVVFQVAKSVYQSLNWLGLGHLDLSSFSFYRAMNPNRFAKDIKEEILSGCNIIY